MNPVREVLRLLASGASQRAVSRQCRISRHAVGNYEFRATMAGLTWPLPDDLDDFALEEMLFPAAAKDAVARHPQPDWDAIHLECKRHKGATLKVLHEEYMHANPDGMGYSRFCQLYEKHVKKLRPYLRQSYRAGEFAFVDFAGPTVTIHASNGKNEEAHIFVGVLGASGMIYAEAIRSQQLPDWLAAHTRMYETWGGLPQIVVPDNLKSAVTHANRYMPDINPSYEEHARHYGVSIIPARPHMPRDKARAERSVQIVERAILFRLRKRMFTSLAELNEAIKEFLHDVNYGKTKRYPRSRAELFEMVERPALRPMPVTRYEFAEIKLVRADASYHFEFDGHAYSVPHSLIGRQLKIRATANTITAYYNGRRVAIHVRSYVFGGETTDPMHRHPRHAAYLAWDREEALRQAAQVGPACRGFLERVGIQEKHVQHEQRAAKAIQQLVRDYSAERVERACERALNAGTVKTSFLRNLLTNNRESMPPLRVEAAAVLQHENLRSGEQFRSYLKGKIQ